ncbi:MAG: CBS domain-containing protein [Euryarchaeota archaeon]|nr:CBS domain-containing protein [Euryarchaeota archaeon]
METRLAVRDVMTRTVVTATPDMSAAEAGKKMVENRVGNVLIVKDGRPVGIVTESDMVAKVISKNIKPGSIKLEQLMSQPLITTKSSDDINDAVLMMAQKKIRRLPVIDDGVLVGIITDADVIQASSEINQILDNLIQMNRENVLDRRDVIVTQGECEECEEFSEDLRQEEGRLKCPRCRGSTSSGVCEICGELSDVLEYVDGSIVCESCWEAVR